MRKKYQVFISSTYQDLRDERAALIQGLLEMNCIPVGMENFPAADMEQLVYIRQEIADSDFYVVIVGGRYGSVNMQSGKSYTELELEIARELNKPCLAFFVEDISALPPEKRESDPISLTKLNAFRSNVLSRLGKPFTDPKDLAGKVSRSLARLIQTHDANGWVRHDRAVERAINPADISALLDAVRTLASPIAKTPKHPVTTSTEAAWSGSRMLFSSRIRISGKEPAIFGFVAAGVHRSYLIRAIGPGLTSFSVAGPLPDPELKIFRGSEVIGQAGPAQQMKPEEVAKIHARSASVGAFPVNPGSDAVLLAEGLFGALTLHVSSVRGYVGEALVEVYEL